MQQFRRRRWMRRQTEERGRMNRSAIMSGMVCLKQMKILRHAKLNGTIRDMIGEDGGDAE